MDKLNLNINGHDNFPDVINMIKDTIDNGDKESAKDYLNQLQEYLAKRDNNILELQTTGDKILKTLEKKVFGTKEESDVDVSLNLQAEMARGK
tara:strand:- start:311 stop:589 length:279 start_codon:yes stop_codon:yes gene_type:complete